MTSARRRAGASWVVAGVAWTAILGLACGSESGLAGEVTMAPDFELDRMDGEPAVSLAELRGKTVVIDFWATWCPPCEFQVPELNAFYDAHHDDSDVAVFGISVDTEGVEVVAEWAAEKGVRYPILLADGDEVARRFGAVGFPTLVVVDAEGYVDLTHVGVIDREILEDALKRLRAGAS